MKLEVQLTSTEDVIDLDGVPVRVWKGHTSDGTEVTAFIHRIMVHKDLNQMPFQAALTTQPMPSPASWFEITRTLGKS